MNKTKELIEKIKSHPEHELIFMYPQECSDYPYTMGHPVKIIVDEYWQDDERIWLKDEDGDDIFDHYVDNIYDDVYPNVVDTTDEQERNIDTKTKEFIDSQDWKPCICVYIHY